MLSGVQTKSLEYSLSTQVTGATIVLLLLLRIDPHGTCVASRPTDCRPNSIGEHAAKDAEEALAALRFLRPLRFYSPVRISAMTFAPTWNLLHEP